MADQTASAWRCGVCGYVHRGDSPPDSCPVCGASRDNFEPFADTPPAAAAATGQWRCVNCGYVHRGTEPPDSCPVCGASRENFEPVKAQSNEGGSGEGPGRVVIIGAGIAGVSAAESLRAASPDCEITLVAKETELPYHRLNLTRYVAGEVGLDSLPLRPESWYAEQRVNLLRGAEVAGIDSGEHRVAVRNGEDLPFDKVIMTAGGHPFVPPLPGATREGVTSFRTLTDAQRILDTARSGGKCVIVGGGILGLETAGGVAQQGGDVTVLEGHDWLLPRQLSQAASPLLERHLAGMGITLRKRACVADILGDEHALSVSLEDAEPMPADLVVLATGVRPNSYLARTAGLTVNQGVAVDNHLRTSHPDIYAAGDVAEHRGVVYGLWGPAQFMGSIAGMNAAGLANEFGGIPRSNILKVLGIELFSIGQFEPLDGSYDVHESGTEQAYLRFVFHDSLMVGAILLGDASQTSAVKKAVEGRADFSGLLKKRPCVADVAAYLAEGA